MRFHKRGSASQTTHDRRRTARHKACEADCWLGWIQNDAFETVPVEIMDLSLGGAKLRSAARTPASGTRIWIAVTTARARLAVAGQILECSVADADHFILRVQFYKQQESLVRNVASIRGLTLRAIACRSRIA